MRTVLVTGGAGFIGSNFVRFLLGEGDTRVVNLDALTYAGNLATLGGLEGEGRHRFVHGDIGDRELVAQLLREHRPRGIVHFAAESHVDRSIGEPAAFVQTNILGTFNLLECALDHWRGLPPAERAAFRFLQVSTNEVYGSLGPDGRFTEASPYTPSSPYSASKAAADHLVRAWHRTYGLPVLTTTSSNNYGPYQFPEKLIPLMILRALEGRPLPLYGDGGNVRDWLYVEDNCRAIGRVLEAGVPGETYNVGADGERTNLEVVDALCAILDELRPRSPHRPHARLKRFVADRPGHDRRYALDAGRARRELGWRPRESFESGLRRTVEWYLANPDWCRRVQQGLPAGERPGLSRAGGAAA